MLRRDTRAARRDERMSDTKLRWGILGTGSIAGTFAAALPDSRTGTLAAVGSRSKESADRFGEKFGVGAARRHASYDALLADEGVDAVYVSTPHPLHAEWAIKSAEAGKHVLCEKPVGLNAAEAMAIVEAARVNGVFLMEAFMYRCHPQAARVADLVRGGAVGEVRLIDATFSFHAGFNPQSRLFDPNLGGGGILDVGGYPVSYARLIAGAASGKPFADPAKVSGAAHLGETGVDEWAAATLKFAGGIVAQVATGVRLNQSNTLTVYGSDGRIEVPTPWIPAKAGGVTHVLVHRGGAKGPERIEVSTDRPLYALEADAVGDAVAAGRTESPAMTWDDTLGNMRALDAWRRAVGLTYPAETPAGLPTPDVAGRPVRKGGEANGAPMVYGRIPHLDKPVSRLVMGTIGAADLPTARVLYDDWFARGGNAFDTAHLYHGGAAERFVGAWLESRGVRDDVVLIVKGAHTPDNNPEGLTRQLHESLGRLRTDRADLYVLHRDNPAVPVGEYVEAVNEHVAAGRVSAWGGSNWSLERVDAANAYAADRGLRPMTCVSNQFSLARMVDPVWGGCLSASDAESRAWFARTRTPLLAWSSQARGFFVPERGASPEKRSDAEMARCWYSDDNFERRRRAFELAERKGVDPINVAAAYVLCQPFPTFALIGPTSLAETRTSMPALGVTLTDAERLYLNLESDAPA